MHTKSSKNIVLWGGYGWGNVGDELTHAVAITEMRAQGNRNIEIITPYPVDTRALFPDLKIPLFLSVHRMGKLSHYMGKYSNLYGIT